MNDILKKCMALRAPLSSGILKKNVFPIEKCSALRALFSEGILKKLGDLVRGDLNENCNFQKVKLVIHD